MGVEKFLALVEEKLGAKHVRVPAEAVAARPAFDRTAHIGVRAQKQAGRQWVGVVLPVGKLTGEQMRGLAKLAADLGDGDIRLTVWQNLLISGVPTDKLALAEAAIAALGLTTKASSIRAGLVACTGNVGCRFSASDTKRHAEEIAHWCEARVALDGPVNIHLTGCHHSCAQHYIGDIGLIGARVPTSEEDTVEGYHILVGGGFGPDAALGREIYRDVKAENAPKTVARMLQGYIANRAAAGESFLAFTRRHEVDALRTMFDAEAGE
jgi:ferredoxin-nitrite reductase